MDPAGSKTTLDDLKAAALSKNHVLCRHTDIVEGDVAVAVWGVIVAENTQHAVDGDTGGVVGDQNDGLLLVDILVAGVGLAHNDVDLAARVASTGGPPFLSYTLASVGVLTR